ncbi:MAG: 5-formyltetrahydrofolate cyclo-ligase [Bacteroidales bacterium]|nr:5-formyltetrahydrofolate cyclo-ligase [Bacteroidales bacterium]
MIHEQKKEYRKLVKMMKDKHSLESYFKESEEICQTIEQLPAFINASTVMAYWSIKGEVFTHNFINKWSCQKRIVLPSVDGDKMKLKLFEGDGNLIPGDLYAIPEPDGPEFDNYDSIDIILVPGIAFDGNNNRMGRGKAYYDRFLLDLSAVKIGICFRFQLFDDIPVDENDMRMDMIVTNNFRKL